MMRNLLRASALICVCFSMNCGGNTACKAVGQQFTCQCSNGMQGTQSCQASGFYSECQCSTPMLTEPPAGAKRIFVTRESFRGNVGTQSPNSQCRAAAFDRLTNPSNNWVAFLTGSGTTIFDSLDDVGPWYALKGAKLFNNKSDIMNGPLSTNIVDIYGDPPASKRYWTGALPSGYGETNCGGWSSIAPNSFGTFGDFASAATWIRAGTLSCDLQLPLLCIEQ
jgi:hypothetical protein